MENVNKCFFSISLENGITITADNASKAMRFLTTLESALYWATVHYADNELTGLAEEAKELQEEVSEAALYISNLEEFKEN